MILGVPPIMNIILGYLYYAYLVSPICYFIDREKHKLAIDLTKYAYNGGDLNRIMENKDE